MLRWAVVLVVVGLLLPSASKAEVRNIVHLSDIHLDQLYADNCGQPSSASQLPWLDGDLPSLLKLQRARQQLTNGTYGRFGCDTAPALFSAVLDHLALVCQQVTCDAIVVSGDEAAHHLNSSQALQAMAAVTQGLQRVASALPRGAARLSSNAACQSGAVPLYIALGNNDVSPDYHFTCNDPWYGTVRTAAWPGVVPDGQLAAWNRSGAYVVSDPFCTGSDRVALVVLNTVLYSSSRKPAFPPLDEDPCQQLAWLSGQLESTPVNYFLGHVPPGVDSYSGGSFLRPNLNANLLRVFDRYAQAPQSMGFFGHRHTDEFRSFFGATGGVTLPALAMQASVSPIFGNNPSFRVYQYDTDADAFVDYEQYVFDLALSNRANLPVWFVEYRFSDAYGLANLTSDAYVQLFGLLQQNATILDSWLERLYCDATKQPPTSLTTQQYVCAQRARNPTEMNVCANATTQY